MAPSKKKKSTHAEAENLALDTEKQEEFDKQVENIDVSL